MKISLYDTRFKTSVNDGFGLLYKLASTIFTLPFILTHWMIDERALYLETVAGMVQTSNNMHIISPKLSLHSLGNHTVERDEK